MLHVRAISLVVVVLLCHVVWSSSAASAATTVESTGSKRPVVHSVAPLQTSAVGDQLTIKGANFDPGKRRNTVMFKPRKGRAVAAVAASATRKTLRVTIPRSVERRMIVRHGVKQPTRFRLRVRSLRLSKSFTPRRLSPTISPKRPSWDRDARPCPAGGCAPSGHPLAAALTTAPAPLGTLVLEEQFDGPAVNPAKWTLYHGPGNAGNGLRRPSALTQEDGQLVITAVWDGSNIVSGGMNHRHDQLYGTYEFRVRADPDPTGQLSGVVLTWPQSGKNVPDGEIDMWETGHSASGRNPWMTYVHRSQDGATDSQVWLTHNSDAAQWHTVRMDWTPDAIRIYVDGMLDGQISDPARIPNQPHHVSMQLDAFSNKPLNGPVRMYVDWVKVYRQM